MTARRCSGSTNATAATSRSRIRSFSRYACGHGGGLWKYVYITYVSFMLIHDHFMGHRYDDDQTSKQSSSFLFCSAVPMQLTVNQRTTECLFDHLEKAESITMSLFILSGPELKATVQFDGPLLAVDTNNPHEINTGLALHEANVIYDKGRKSIEGIRFSDVVDFEHLNIAEELDEIYPDGEDGAGGGDATDGSESIDERRHRREMARRVALESRERREAHKRKQRSKVRMEGEPYVHTIQVPITGWYRFCIVGSYSQITAEIDLRKESDYGGIDGESGHVWTMQERTLEDEEKLMEEDTAASEGIKDEDFEPTREKLKTLRRLLAEIQSKQSQERHRLIVHAATNEHSHSRMVLSSLLETILFMVVTGFQVFTIRRWFQSAPALGR